MAFEGLIQSLLTKKETFRQKAINKVNQEIKGYTELIETGNTALCPSPSEIERLLQVKQNLEENILRLNRNLQPVKETVGTVQATIRTINPIIRVLKFLPIPAKWVTVGLTTRFSDTLNNLKDFTKELEADTENLDYTITNTQKTFTEISSKLQEIETVLSLCSGKAATQNTSPEFQNLIETLNQQRNQDTLTEEYKGYRIEVKNDPDSPPIAPKRFAVAVSPTGAKVYQGPSSFSSSTKILIEEVRFYIDQLTR